MPSLTFLGPRARSPAPSTCSKSTASASCSTADCSGAEGTSPAQLVAAAGPPGHDRRRRPHARAHRSHAAGCRGSSSQGFKGPVYCTGGTPISAGWCCPTRRTCRKRTRSSRTSAASASTSRRCRSTPKKMPPKRCRDSSRRRSDKKIAVVDGHRGRVHQRRTPARLVVRAA